MSIEERKLEIIRRLFSVEKEEILDQIESLISTGYPAPSEALFSALVEAKTCYPNGEGIPHEEVMSCMRVMYPELF